MLAPSPVAKGTARLASIAAPWRGWNTRDPLAEMEPGYAPRFDNFVVEGGQPRVRRGWSEWATGLPARVDGLLHFNGAGATESLFAVSSDSVFNITAAGAVGVAEVTGLTSARMDGINVAASGGNYLLAFNGTDTPKTYDGTSWADWAATGITGDIQWAGQVAGRVFCGRSDYLGFYYGAAGAIAGAYTAFPLQGIARKGGGVCAMATLSGDGGDGPQDLSVFITTEGEAIVYAGTDPSDANAWGLVGRWALPRPIGAPHRCVANYGGDVLYLSDAGILPLSAFRSGADAAQVIDKAALTRAIGETWRAVADASRSASGWGIIPLTRHSLVVCNVPRGDSDALQIVVSDGGAVSRWFGVPSAVWAEALGGRVFCGDATAAGGRVLLWGEDIDDDGDGIRSEAITAFTALRTMGRTKRALRVQPVLRDASGADYTVRVLTDYRVPVSGIEALGAGAAAPALPSVGSGSYLVWGTGLWGVGLWGGVDTDVALPYKTASAVGQAMALRLTMTSGNGRPAWLASNLIYDAGGPIG
jgi:hypothetical protein